MDWPPPTEDKTTLENTLCLGSGRQGLIQRLKNGREMGGGGEERYSYTVSNLLA